MLRESGVSDIQFVKTLSYNTKGDWGYVDGILSQRIDPPSNANASFYFPSGSIVLHSTLRRVTETLGPNRSVHLIEMFELREVPFNLGERASGEREFQEQPSVFVRKRFKESFCSDTLFVSRVRLFAEIRAVLIRALEQKSGQTAVISHSFRLALIDAFIKTSGEIMTNPRLIHDFIIDDKKTRGFGESFFIVRKDIIDALSVHGS